MNETQDTTTQVAQLIDAVIGSVRWCRQHLEERSVTSKLRELQITVASLALAIEYEMDGETEKAANALAHAEWNIDPLRGIPEHLRYGC